MICLKVVAPFLFKTNMHLMHEEIRKIWVMINMMLQKYMTVKCKRFVFRNKENCKSHKLKNLKAF